MRVIYLALIGACDVASAALMGAPALARAAPARASPAAVSMQQVQTSSPKGVVITGGAGGVGYAYADEFLRRGHWVVICDVKDPQPAVMALRQKHAGGLGRIYGTTTDVRRQPPGPETPTLASFPARRRPRTRHPNPGAGLLVGERDGALGVRQGEPRHCTLLDQQRRHQRRPAAFHLAHDADVRKAHPLPFHPNAVTQPRVSSVLLSCRS